MSLKTKSTQTCITISKKIEMEADDWKAMFDGETTRNYSRQSTAVESQINEMMHETEEEEKKQSEVMKNQKVLVAKKKAIKKTYSRFFIIKRYEEEDVHKAIKYNIWSSNERGNQILDAAFQDAQAQGREVYLFFSIIKSNEFLGVAKMKSGVNNSKNHNNLWKKGNWPGSIKIEWVQIKDIENKKFMHLKNPLNDNSPACFGIDCQEIEPTVGNQMLDIVNKA